MNTTPLTLGWGLRDAVPANATSAWGARLLIDMTGRVDIVPDRIDIVGDPNFLDLLKERFPPRDLIGRIADGLRSGEFTTRTSDDIILFEDDAVKVVANPNGSGGYLYVAAFPIVE